jgi:hypothetical protein
VASSLSKNQVVDEEVLSRQQEDSDADQELSDALPSQH